MLVGIALKEEDMKNNVTHRFGGPNVTSISVYLDRRDHVVDPMTEEDAARLRGFIAWEIKNKRLMDEADEARREADRLETDRTTRKAIRRHLRRKKKRLSAKPRTPPTQSAWLKPTTSKWRCRFSIASPFPLW